MPTHEREKKNKFEGETVQKKNDASVARYQWQLILTWIYREKIAMYD